MADQNEPKLHIDSDWKQEAQKEKEKLREQQASAQAGPEGVDPNRPVEFDDLVRMLASQALMYLGAIPADESGRAILAPDMAKLHIDMLGVLEAKTKGNLSQEESQTMTAVLSELRMQFVEISKAVQKAIAEGKIKPEQIGGAASMGIDPGS